MKRSNCDFLMLVVAFLVGYFFQHMTGIKLVEGHNHAWPCQTPCSKYTDPDEAVKCKFRKLYSKCDGYKTMKFTGDHTAVRGKYHHTTAAEIEENKHTNTNTNTQSEGERLFEGAAKVASGLSKVMGGGKKGKRK